MAELEETQQNVVIRSWRSSGVIPILKSVVYDSGRLELTCEHSFYFLMAP